MRIFYFLGIRKYLKYPDIKIINNIDAKTIKITRKSQKSMVWRFNLLLKQLYHKCIVDFWNLSSERQVFGAKSLWKLRILSKVEYKI